MSTEVLAEQCATPTVRSRSTAQARRSDLLGNAAALIIPMLLFMEVKLVGRLFLSEILLLCMLPLLLIARGRLLFAPLPRKLFFFGLAWLWAQILTDFIRDTPFDDWSRGWSKIIFLLLNFSTIYLLLNGKAKRFFLFAVGIALGQILIYLFNPNIYAEGLPWKFGYGLALTLFVVLASQIRIVARRTYWSATFIFGVGALNFYMGFRSLGLICLLTAAFVLVKQSNLLRLRRMKLSKVTLLILLGGVVIYGITELYEYSASEGWLGNKARDEYLVQSAGDMGILLGGRTEILASAQAVIDSPIIGHGSWAKDPKYVDIMENTLLQHGYEIQGEIESDLIPTHSYIMGAWVESGFVGAIFWIWVLVLAARTLIATYGTNSTLTPLIAFVAFNLLWNIPFSPFGAEARLYVAYDLSLMMFALTLPKSSMTKKGMT